MRLKRGDMVTMDGRLAAVVGVEGDPAVPDGHVAIWFGDAGVGRALEVGSPRSHAEAWTVPAEYCSLATVTLKH
jgi:hypothetical protein